MAEKEFCASCGGVGGCYPLCKLGGEGVDVSKIHVCRECGGVAGHDPLCPAGEVGEEMPEKAPQTAQEAFKPEKGVEGDPGQESPPEGVLGPGENPPE